MTIALRIWGIFFVAFVVLLAAWIVWSLASVAKKKEPRPPKKWWNDDDGVVIAEAAVILPVLVFLSLALIDIQWMTRTAGVVEYITMESARCEAIVSPACIAPNSTQSYALKLAQQMRLATDAQAFQLSTPPCTMQECDVSITYTYKALGAWFPVIKIQRTGTASVPPQAPE